MWNLDDPRREPERALLDTPGAFLWWYADALDAHGDGLVCIASWGLPFLPGDRAARLAGHPPRPAERPSLNLVVYAGGRPVYYTLYRPQQASWDDDGTLRFDGTTLRTRDLGDGRRAWEAEVDLPVPGSLRRLRGRFAVHGPAARIDPADRCGADADHRWAPILGPARMDVDLRIGTEALLFRHGLPAYHDRNASPTPLDALGIARWTWGRHTFGDRTIVHYLTWPDDPTEPAVLVAATLDATGAVTVHPVQQVARDQRRTGRAGMTWWRRLTVPLGSDRLEIVHGPPVDDGPFYLRLPTRARLGGQAAPGWAEWCEPDRIDLARHRWLVSMCVQQPTGGESAWLPLFSGPQATRWSRLAAHWLGTRPAPRIAP